ncbi:hypothetical protein RDI58_018714 [Solanum bulbocastanum]|uniref:Reverse transcriptase n=1 Tax=Solanum bulbocastanum TaxID=147425 RepID=A0AAN8YA06_SOLBU
MLGEIRKWSDAETLVLQQKSRVNWIKSEDANTMFFHAWVKIRESKNSITSVYDNAGTKVQDPQLVEAEFIRFYSELMRARAENLPSPNAVFLCFRVAGYIDKSCIYMTGMEPRLRQEILDYLGYQEDNCKIKCRSAKLLSYAGRTRLTKSVIFGIQTYWGQIFLLPKRILKMIGSICRTYLWTGNTLSSKKALISWAKLCTPQAAGGQNLINMTLRIKQPS